MVRTSSLLALAAFTLMTVVCPFALAQGKPQVLKRADVAGVQVGGLTPPQARQRVAHLLAPKLNVPLILTDGVKRVTRKRRELGVIIDTEAMIGHVKAGQTHVPLQFVVNQQNLRLTLRHIASQFAAPAQDAKIVERGGGIRIVPGQSARTLNIETSAKRIAALLEAHGATHVLPVVLDKKPARVAASAFKGITGRLGRFSTTFKPAAQKRTHNIRVAVSVINGKIIAPGTVFSLNDTLGERTHEHGYLTAPVYVNGKLVPGIGGGVSQVAGTLFNAALLAGLPIVEYGTHAHPVPYMPIGHDATLAWQHIDLRFKNNTSAPLYIAYTASGNQVVATLYGAKVPGKQITLSVVSKTLGPHHKTAVLYRVIKKNGKVVQKEKIGRSDYNWKPENAD